MGVTAEIVRAHIMDKFLTCEVSTLTDTTELVRGGVIDSIGVLLLLAWLEERWSIQFSPEESAAKNFDTVQQIVKMVESKL